VVFLGSSRSQHGVRAASLERRLSAELAGPVAVFNYSLAGGSCLSGLFQWWRLREAGARPALVVVEVVPSFLDAWAAPDSYLRYWPAAEMDLADVERMARHDPERGPLYRENLLARLFPLYGHRRVLLSRLARNLVPPGRQRLPCPPREVTPDPPPGERPAATYEAWRQVGAAAGRFRLEPGRLPPLEDLLADLRAAGVPAAVLTMPEGPLCRSWYRPGAQAEIEAVLRGACARHGAAFVIASAWFDDESMFYDSHHLTGAGAERFCARLAAEALAPLLRRPATSD
jgi:hypothetical protein